ncbi:ead/Ea22-like family protein [Citrobacter braakii]|uniref:ead/Ea22-like family protein n=1 Tax=Citrobacter braakii TaxID=57706 RepID=UPI00242A9953|nr:ead/Ea22-like family protein [Citrobacter braakii]WFW80676.1 ead/Ea22-like family protein [Citrobacter braakii]
MTINKQALRENAESTIGTLENIAGFEPSDIDGDTVELRFETEGGFDTGCEVSIVDQCQKAADVVRALLDELEAAEKRIAEQREYYEGVIADGSRRIAELEAKIETSDKLQDSAFRHGLQHGFGYGQTNDQARYEQCIAAYSPKKIADGIITKVGE